MSAHFPENTRSAGAQPPAERVYLWNFFGKCKKMLAFAPQT